MKAKFHVACGDMREVLAKIPANSIDAIVSDPPYGLTQNKRGGTGEASLNLRSPAGRSRISTGGFMGCGWDAAVPGPEYWAACLRVAKPGAHILAFGGARTAHRLACAIEDAGWEIRDCLSWLYGSGFPKSHNLDGAWSGWGTALKPAWEPIYLARKPFAGTVAGNVLEHGCGALNIDGCRIETDENLRGGRHPIGEGGSGADVSSYGAGINKCSREEYTQPTGRWPANLVLDETAAEALDAQTGALRNGGQNATSNRVSVSAAHGVYAPGNPTQYAGDSGGASRFFYVAKASRNEREAGLGGFAETNVNDGRKTSIDNAYPRGDTQRRNTHPTVKPIALMRWCVRLITPPGGTVLDPFNGSGSTGIAAVKEGMRYFGVELNPEYVTIANARIQHALETLDNG